MTPTPDPESGAEVSRRARSSHAHHEAGHAVAAVARGGELVKVQLGQVDWASADLNADTPGGTYHRTEEENVPFVTFAGPWATAKWTIENDPDEDDFDEALDAAWNNSSDGDLDKYEQRLEMLSVTSEGIGLPLGHDQPWVPRWLDELEPLWPAICEVAALLIDGQTVTHADVRAAIDRLPDAD